MIEHEPVEEATEREFPRKGSVVHTMHFTDKESRKKHLSRITKANKFFMIPLYRMRILPLLGFGRYFAILSTIGRKTGKKRYTPVGHSNHDGVIHVVAAHGPKTSWIRNMVANPHSVWIQAGFRKKRLRPVLIDDPEEGLAVLKWRVKRNARASGTQFGWNSKKDDPETADLASLLPLIAIIKFEPVPTK